MYWGSGVGRGCPDGSLGAEGESLGPLMGGPKVACRFLKMAMSPVVILEIFLSILK